MDKKTLGAFISVLRKAKGLTQKQLAEMLNVSDKAVSRWERDECAPDLSVIPVLAEIFDITADELLRGQRKQANAPVTHYEKQKTEKQIHYLLKQKLTEFSIITCVSIGLALFGLVAAMIGNLGFLRAYIGFFVACLFYTAAILCQAVNLLRGLQSLDGEEMEPQAEAPRQRMVLLSELSITITGSLFAGSMPLIVLVSDTYEGLSARSWGQYGLLWGTVGAIVCLVICAVINHRMGYMAGPNLSTPKNKLRLRSTIILSVVLLITLIGHSIFHSMNYANLHWLTAGTKWESWDELKEYLETPISENGEALEFVSARNTGYVEIRTYLAPDGTTLEITERNFVLVYQPDKKTPEYQCIRRNQYIQRFYYSHTDDHFPIYTLNTSQVMDAIHKLNIINALLYGVYIVEILIGIFLYRRNVKKLQQI